MLSQITRALITLAHRLVAALALRPRAEVYATVYYDDRRIRRPRHPRR